MAVETYEYLSNEERLAIVASHIKNVEYGIYNDEITKMEATSSATPDQATIDSANLRIIASSAKKVILNQEVVKINMQIAADRAAVLAALTPPPQAPVVTSTPNPVI